MKDPLQTSSDMFATTFRQVREYAQKNPAIIIAFSGGKESCVCMDLAVRSGFQAIYPFYLYTIPGLEVIENQLAWAQGFWNIPFIAQYPSGVMHQAFKFGLYRPNHIAFDHMPVFGPSDVHKLIVQDFGCRTIMTGIRGADSVSRRRMASRGIQQIGYYHPIVKWNKWHIMAYLKLRNIPLPPSAGGATSDIGIDVRSALWLYREHPEDFARMERVFPYYRAILCRKLWYDIPTDKELGLDTNKLTESRRKFTPKKRPSKKTRNAEREFLSGFQGE